MAAPTDSGLTNVAYARVRDMILDGSLRPGQKIIQERLATDLGISRTPLRDALRRLEAERLVRSIPRRGMFVREISSSEIVDIYDCRMALEGMATRLFTLSASNDQVDQLISFFEGYRSGADTTTASYRHEDLLFHGYIINNCGNKTLSELITRGSLLASVRKIGLVRPPEQTDAEHAAIVTAVTKRNADEAEQLMRQHFQSSRELLSAKS